jgi:choline dehydrogenase-like flavoprotein
MITIELATIAHIPPFAEVTLRTSLDRWADNDLEGNYQNGRWIYELSDPKYLAGFECKFALNRVIYSGGDNFTISGDDNQRYTFYINELKRNGQDFGSPTEPVVELGKTHTSIFDVSRPLPSDELFDVIVIGSGMCGGVLADRLSDNGVRTLVLEAGGVPLETHIANLPRSHNPSSQAKIQIWQRWGDYQVRNYESGDENRYDGSQAFNLGGRSVFWGGFIPRMSSWELDFWPRNLKWDLEDRYYQLAEDLIGRSTAPVNDYTREIHRVLRTQLPDYSHFDAPMAVRQRPSDSNTISTGMFSTADLLLESFRTQGELGNANLNILTHHQVIKIEPSDPCKVIAQDIISKQEHEFRAKYVVLCCGCLESSRLAKRSNLGNELVGLGVTEHPVAYVNFSIPPESPYYNRFSSIKVVSQPQESISGGIRDPFNILMELNADFNQGRFLDEDIFQEQLKRRNMICEIIFLSNKELILSNQVDFDVDNNYRPIARIKNPGLGTTPKEKEDLEKRVKEIGKRIVDELRGQILDEGVGDGGVGGVAHEVGSLRMAVTDSNNIDRRSQLELEGVVDENGKFLDQEFVYACDMSIFPTSPAANPSLTAVALAIRLGDRLIQLVNS